MKRIALLLSLSISTPALAQSEWLARTSNESGGEIVLLVSQGKCPDETRQVFATDPTGRIEWGCYTVSSTHVHAFFGNGAERAYPTQGWTINPVYQTQQKPQRKPDVAL